MIKHLKLICILLCFTLPLAFFGGHKSMISSRSASRGNYFFEKTKNHLNLKKIVLKFPDNNTITITQNDSLWYIEEADGYFASFAQINSFIKLIRDTVIYRSDVLLENQDQKYFSEHLSIKTIDAEGHIVDDAKIAPKSDQNKFHYALLNNTEFLYQIIGNFNLSSNPMDWVQMPLLALDYNHIKQIQSDSLYVYRPYVGSELKIVNSEKEVPQMRGLMNNFWYLSAEEIRHAVHFNRKNYRLAKSFEIVFFNGLIYKLDIFNGNDEYWISINLDRSMSITPDAATFIKENSMLYKGWYFRINHDIGHAIVSFIL